MFSLSQKKTNSVSKTLATSVIILLLFNAVLPLSIFALKDKTIPSPDLYEDEFEEEETVENEQEELNTTPSPYNDEEEQETEDEQENSETNDEINNETEEDNSNDEEKSNLAAKPSVWSVDGNRHYTNENIVQDFEYTIDEFDNLKIVFTKLPTESSKLNIEKVDIGDKIGNANIIGNAYDITSDMQNGEFEFTIYMPIPADYSNKELEIKYSNDNTNFNDISGEENTSNYVKASGIDHLTTYVVVDNPSPPPVSNLQMIIDNEDDECTTSGGTWTLTDNASSYNGNYLLSDTTVGRRAQWQFSVIENGEYEIYARWPGDTSHGNPVNYTVTYQGGSTILPIQVDQTSGSGGWYQLGTYNYATGSTYFVILENSNEDPDGLLAADAVMIQSTESPSEVWVDDDWIGYSNGDDLGSGRYFGYNGFATIQEGIDAVLEDGTVYVAEGNYEEQLDIQKNLTLSGAGTASTTVTSPDNLVSKWTSLISGTTYSNYPIVYVNNANNVIIEDFTINGAGKGNANNRFYGIAYRNAGGTVQNCGIINIKDTPTSSERHGAAFYSGANDGITYNVNLLSCQINNYQKNGVTLSDSINSIIAGNTITGIGPTDLISQNGIQISDIQNCQITGNYISNNFFIPDSNSAVGVLSFEIGLNVAITNNNIFDNEVGLWNLHYPPAYYSSPITAHHNSFYDNDRNAIDDRSESVWDDGSEGNSWDDYTGIDLDGDGVGDTQLQYQIDNFTMTAPYAQDNYPLTTNYLTTPVILAPPNTAFYPTSASEVDWTDSDGTFPSFEYQFEAYGDTAYSNLVWDSSGWITNSEISTLGIPDGMYYIRVRARDSEGNESYWSNGVSNTYVIVLDTNPPVTTLTSPADDTYWNTDIPIQGTTEDYSTLLYVDIYYRNTGTIDPWTLIETLTDSDGINNPFDWTYNWNPDLMPASNPPHEGSYDIRAIATDILGHIESDGHATNITYDITDPVPVITQPNNNEVVNGTINITGTITELHLDNYELSIHPVSDPSDITFIASGGNTNVSADFNTTILPDGEYVLNLEAVDRATNSAEDSINIIIDNTHPTVEITYPIQFYLSDIFTIRGTVEDDNPYSYELIIEDGIGNYVEGTGLILEPNSFNNQPIMSWDTTGINGLHTITLTAQDEAGNQNDDIITVIIDNIDPDANITNPHDGDTVGGTISINGNIIDDNFDEYTLTIYPNGDPGNIVETFNGISQSFTHEFNTLTYISQDPNFGDGVYTIELYALDLAGHEDTTTINITVDNTKPFIEPELEDSNYNEGDNIEVDITGKDDISLDQLCYQIVEIDGGVFTCLSGNGVEYTWTLELTTLYPQMLQNGVYQLEYYLLDSSTPANQSDSDPDTTGDQNYITTFTVNNVKPNVIPPTDQEIIEGQSTNKLTASFTDPSYIEGSGNDPDDAPWTVTIDYGDGTSIKTIAVMNEPGEFSIPSHTYIYNGIYTVTIKVAESEDGSNESGIAIFKVKVEDKQPTVSISAYPSNKVYAWVPITLTASVEGGNEPYTYEWSGICQGSNPQTTIKARPGIYTCTIKVTDVDGDKVTETMTLTFYPHIIDTADDQDETDESNDNDTDESENVLSIVDCGKKSKISGYVFIDDNKNNNKDEDEKGLNNIQIEVYFDESENGDRIASAKTNNEGYWETELCQGEYSLTINLEDLPDNAELEWGNYIFITVEENENINNINFPVIKYGSFLEQFNVLWCILPFVFILIVSIFLYFKNKKSK